MSMLNINEDAFRQLQNNIETAADEYQTNYRRLANLMSEITRGDIQGEPADDLLKKFEEKKGDFEAISNEIDTILDYIKNKYDEFEITKSEVSGGFR